MEHYDNNDFIQKIITAINQNKTDSSILQLIKLNMVNHKIILNNLDATYISYLINICDKYNLKYELVGFNKKILIINNTSHSYLNINSKQYYSKIPHSIDNNDNTNSSLNNYFNESFIDYNKKYNIKTDENDDYIKLTTNYDKLDDIKKYFKKTSSENTDEHNKDISEEDDKDISEKDISEEDISEEDSSEENSSGENSSDEDSSEDDSNDEDSDEEYSNEEDIVSSSSYTINKASIKKSDILKYNNIFTQGETVIYLISNINLVCNMLIMYKLFVCDYV